MANKSAIQWTDATWNVARGCAKVDDDCKYCYMYRDSFSGTRYNPRQIIRTKTVFNMPLKYKETKSQVWEGRPLIFTSSLTDFFHEDIDSYRDECWDIIRKCPHLIFQILTKRPERIHDHLPADWGKGWDNVWLGTSIGSQKSIDRIKHLMCVPATIRFLSLEPLHGEINLDEEYDLSPMDCGAHFSEYIDWVIVGGESGNDSGPYRYRPCELDWIDLIVANCSKFQVPIFIKQLGTHLSKKLIMTDRHGGNINEFPEYLRLREFP